MWASKADIARGIIADDRSPGPNELSHRERVALVLSVFDADTIDFEEVYDYGVALVCLPRTSSRRGATSRSSSAHTSSYATPSSGSTTIGSTTSTTISIA
jgi:hypothetical protein